MVPIKVNVYEDIVVVVGPRHGFEADNAAAEFTGRSVETFRRAVRSDREDPEAGHVWKYVLRETNSAKVSE